MNTESTVEERFKAAVVAVRRQGVKIRQNVRKCCRGCIMPSDLGFPAEADDKSEIPGPYAYTFGGQGQALKWAHGEPVDSRGRPEAEAWFNHGGGGGDVVAETFREFGFTVEWDGTEVQCVKVIF